MEWVKSGPELAQRACHPFCDDWEVPTPRWTCEGDKEGRGGKKGEGTAAHGGMGIAEDAGGVRGGKGVHERSPAGDPVAGAQFLLLLALFPRRWVYSLRPAANARADVSSAPFSSRGSASSSSGSSDGVRVHTSPPSARGSLARGAPGGCGSQACGHTPASHTQRPERQVKDLEE